MSEIYGHFRLQRGRFTLNVNFRLPAQGITVIFGASGSGKTTLLRCIAGLERVPQGMLTIKDSCWQDERQFFFASAPETYRLRIPRTQFISPLISAEKS